MVMSCNACALHKTRHTIVNGRGNIPADILFIGEAPGHSEDLLGKAFIGPSGVLLDSMRRAAGIDHITTYFINCVLCRPVNREPLPEEILACSKHVREIIEQVHARWVVLVGTISQRIYRVVFRHAIKITHPSALLRLGGEASQGFRESVIKLQQGIDL